ncbi:MAG: hypothetical protein RL355_1009, partial [Actinomycetota bacterium]
MNNPGITVGELGEFELIDQIQKRLAT